jgi:hypothetical protein
MCRQGKSVHLPEKQSALRFLQRRATTQAEVSEKIFVMLWPFAYDDRPECRKIGSGEREDESSRTL